LQGCAGGFTRLGLIALKMFPAMRCPASTAPMDANARARDHFKNTLYFL